MGAFKKRLTGFSSMLLVMAVAALLPTDIFSGTTGKISGRVIDGDTGEGLPGANVLVTGTTFGAATDADGYFTILRLPPGSYSVEVSMVGYKKLIKTEVAVRVDLTTRVDYNLAATVLSGEEITVVAEQPLVIRDLTSSSSRVTATEIEDIASVTSVTDVIQLMPGVVGEGEQLHVRGGRSGEVVYLIDGLSVNDPLFNNEVVDVNKYAIDEVELQTGGYNAEYGNVQSGIVNIIPRGGGERYSGRLAYFTDDFGSGKFPSDILNDAKDPLTVDPNAYFKPEGTGLRANSLNTDRWEFNLGGPEPISDLILPALGINGLKNKVTFYVSGTAEMSDGFLPNEHQDAELVHHDEIFEQTAEIHEAGEADEVTFVNPRKVDHPFMSSFLGLFDWGGRFRNNLNYSAVLNYRPNADIKTSMSFVGSKFWRDDYRHTYKFQPDHSQQLEGTSSNMVFTWTHNLSDKTFYELKFGYLRNNRFEYPGIRNGIRLTPEFMNNRISGLEAIDDDLVGSGDGDDNFFEDDFTDENPDLAGFYRTGWNGGSDNLGVAAAFDLPGDTWSKHLTQVYTIKGDVLSQVTRNHQVKAGFEIKINDLDQRRIDNGGNKVPSRRSNPPDDGPFITSGALRDFYDREPGNLSGYIQDKIEFESLIVNFGLRFDNFNPGSEVFEINEAFQTEETEKKVVNDKNYLSPRLGISHPITDRSTLYFFYGRFVQIPTLSELFRRQNRFRVFQNQLNTFGNPDLEAEETISYEVGFDHQLTDDWKIGVTGFFKDIRNQINFETFGTEASPFRKLVNRDFGSDRGFEFELIKRYSHYFSGSVSYTLMWATTRASTFDRGIGAQGIAAFPNLKEVPSDWDQRHTINANISFEIPAGQGFRFLGTTFDRVGLNIFTRYGSGLPFTIDEDADPLATENSERLPYFLTVDLRLRKDFKLFRSLLATLYVDVNNLFDRRNLLNLVEDAEHSCIECELPLLDPVTGEEIGTQIKRFEHGNPRGDGRAADLNPEQFGAPRQILLGLGLRF
ncbi:MAG: TonB-dependent receptor domain-containing protein [bacterium]